MPRSSSSSWVVNTAVTSSLQALVNCHSRRKIAPVVLDPPVFLYVERGTRYAMRGTSRLAPRPILIAALNHEAVLPRGQSNAPKLGDADRFVRNIAQAVLAAQLALNAV